MAAGPTHAFERTFPRREWITGLGRFALFWSILNGLLLATLLLIGGLVAGLLIDQGELAATLEPGDVARFEAVTGLKVLQAPAVEESAAPKDAGPARPAAEAADPAPAAPTATPAPANEANPETSSAETSTDEAPATPSTEASTAPVATSGPDFFAPAPGAEDAEAAADVVLYHVEDHGILPAVWRTRDTWWGGWLSAAYRRFPVLQQNLTALLTLLMALAVVWVLRVVCLTQLRLACREAGLEVSTRLRRQLHRQAMRLATEDLDDSTARDAQTLFRQETDRVRLGLYDFLMRGSRYPWELVFLAVAAFSVDALLTTQWGLLSILGWYLISRGQQSVDKTRAQAADRAERQLGSLAGTLLGAKLLRGYGMENLELTEFQSRLQRYTEAVRVQHRVQDDPLWLRLVVSLACVALAAFLLFVLGAKVLSGEVTPAGAAVFLAAFLTAIVIVRRLQLIPRAYREVSLATDKIWRFLDRLPTVSQAVGAKFVQPLTKSLHLLDVSYQPLGGRKLLDRIELPLTAGRTYAVVSLDPLEAKAFAYLLPRFIEPQSGRVLFDGEDIAWGTLESIRAETLVVSANDPLLPGSILDNIRAGQPEITLTQATEAAKQARAHNFISRLPQGYETDLEGQESQLDIGQRFRLSLARALLRKPSLLIIEEPEGLDDDTKQLLDDTYDRIVAGRTVLFLPQRLSSLRRADDIILLRQGKVEALGPHALLVKESPLYRHWEYLHFHEFRHDGAA